MYLEFYKLKIKPFQITVDPKFLWLGEKHKEALATLRYGITDNRGFLLLTGEVGTGKTILINRLVSTLNLDTVVATLPDPDLSSMDFYNLLADGFRMNRTFVNKADFLIALRDFLHQSYKKGQSVLLVIDESQRLNHHLMEDIRVLSNIELQDRKLLNIFFVGQQEFNSILNAPQNRALAQRITVRYHIEALEAKEIGLYIAHRLKVAGSSESLFDGEAFSEIYNFSKGIPRLINILCDHALLTGYARGVKKIDAKIIKECSQELRIPNKATNNPINEESIEKKRINDGVVEKVKDASAKTTVSASPSLGSEIGVSRESRWKYLYFVIVIVLVAMIGVLINQYTSLKKPRYGDEDLTPQKYKSTLEKESELLEKRLKDGELNPNPKDEKSSVQANPADKVGERNAAKTDGPTRETGGTAGGASVSETAGVNTTNTRSGRKSHDIEPLPLIKEKIVIYFTVNSNDIDNLSYPILDRISDYLTKNTNEKINIRGYTDTSGSASYNENVSRFRANTVKSYLVGKGVQSSNINIYAMGAGDPIGSNDSPEGRRQNRRVEIEFIKN
jgi:general secretion pathway protein A